MSAATIKSYARMCARQGKAPPRRHTLDTLKNAARELEAVATCIQEAHTLRDGSWDDLEGYQEFTRVRLIVDELRSLISAVEAP
jgi:hypothetical protein